MTAVQTPDSIMLRLRTDTRPHHDRAEQTGFQKALASGTLPRELYVESLVQMFCLHRALEAHLRALGRRDTAAAGVVRDYQYQEPYLREDLAYFGRDIAEIAPLAATQRLIDRLDQLAADEPRSLLGVHYVLEGSKNGSKMLTPGVRRAYKLAGEAGTRYLDPYGDRQREYWGDFRSGVDALDLTPAQRNAMVGAASATFAGITEIYEELFEAAATDR